MTRRSLGVRRRNVGAEYEIETVLDRVLPPAHLIVTALALAFPDDGILMTRLVNRGWDLPGGHLEPGETPEQALRREVMEETGATLTHTRLTAHERIRGR